MRPSAIIFSAQSCRASTVREIVLDEAAITLFAGNDEVPFLYGDYNYCLLYTSDAADE